jgi:hypothetical protein
MCRRRRTEQLQIGPAGISKAMHTIGRDSQAIASLDYHLFSPDDIAVQQIAERYFAFAGQQLIDLTTFPVIMSRQYCAGSNLYGKQRAIIVAGQPGNTGAGRFVPLKFLPYFQIIDYFHIHHLPGGNHTGRRVIPDTNIGMINLPGRSAISSFCSAR